MTGPVDLYTVRGEHLRHCPTGATEALEAVHRIHPTAPYVRPSDDQALIVVRWPGTVKVYSYEVRPAIRATVIEFPVRQSPAAEIREGA